MEKLSNMEKLGSLAHNFSLLNTNPDFGGSEVSMSMMNDSPLFLVAFICNHCPYVIHIRDAFVNFVSDYQEKGLAVVAISSNDIQTHPADSPKRMQEDSLNYKYSFPYLYDETQSVAKAYRASCTPDFFLYDADRKLVYRGQYDSSRPGNDKPVTGYDLRSAVESLLRGETILGKQHPSIGCNIKWRIGEEPDYY